MLTKLIIIFIIGQLLVSVNIITIVLTNLLYNSWEISKKDFIKAYMFFSIFAPSIVLLDRKYGINIAGMFFVFTSLLYVFGFINFNDIYKKYYPWYSKKKKLLIRLTVVALVIISYLISYKSLFLD